VTFLESLRNHPLGVRLAQLVPLRAWQQRPRLFFILCAVTVVSSLLLGGGTRGGFLSDTILELIAIPAFLASLATLVALPRSKSKQRAEWALMLCLAIAALPLVQLVPLPPWLWTELPNREQMVTVFDLLGRELPWLPISVSPSATWVSVLSLLPPFAIFLGVIQLSYRERRVMSLIFVAVGIVAAFVGLAQVAQGPDSPLRFFAVTNESEAVGFFANRNHFAALLYSLLLFGAAWATNVAFTVGSWSERKNFETSTIATLTACFLGLVILIVTESITRSRAGLVLTIIAIAGALALPLADRRRSSGGVTPVRLILASASLAIVLAVQFALYRILDRFADDPLADSRVTFARNTIAAAKAYMPFGSGIGTFVSVYPIFELPQDAISNAFVNHAHDDLLEVWLEGGVISLCLIAAFATWFLLCSAKIWWRVPDNIRAIDLLLARAATIVVPLIIAHCAVDYPLRTGAIMAVFAFSCALLIEPLAPAWDEMTVESAKAREQTMDSISRAGPARVPATADGADTASAKTSPQPKGRWGEDVEWPDQWRDDSH
jgi:O-antigen ligase/polysaccharide polymerase Wzy-like membrane protein